MLYVLLREWAALLCLTQSVFTLRLETVKQQNPVIHSSSLTLNVREYGAVGVGISYDTDAFQKAIHELTLAGGGTLRVPSGDYLVTTITLATNVTLYLEKGATLFSSNKTKDWATPRANHSVTRQCGGVWDKPYLGGPVVFCTECTNITIRGEGIIDGNGQRWWNMKNRPYRRGYLVLLVNCTNVYIQGLTFQNAPTWNVVPKFCRNVTMENLLILNDYVQSHNTDGINPYGCDGVIIRNSIIVTGDDCIAIKSGPRPSCGIPSQNILVHNVTCIGSHGLTIGSEMNAGVRNIRFSNITIDGRNTQSSQGVRIKSQRGRGGFVQNVIYENIRIHNVKIGIQVTLNYREVDKSVRPTPKFEGITIRNVFATSVKRLLGSIDGLEESFIHGITMENVYLFGDEKVKPLKCSHVSGATFTNVYPRPKMDASCGPQSAFSLFDMLTIGMPKWVHLPHWFW